VNPWVRSGSLRTYILEGMLAQCSEYVCGNTGRNLNPLNLQEREPCSALTLSICSEHGIWYSSVSNGWLHMACSSELISYETTSVAGSVNWSLLMCHDTKYSLWLYVRSLIVAAWHAAAAVFKIACTFL
jgi:hypothetical protein